MVRSSNPLLDIYLSLACHHHFKITKLPCLLHPILFFLSFVFVKSRKYVAGGLIGKKCLLSALACANVSGHLHFSHVHPSLSWNHLQHIGPVYAINCSHTTREQANTISNISIKQNRVFKVFWLRSLMTRGNAFINPNKH